MSFMTRVATRYGKIARIPLRGKYLYLVSDPELLRELLVTHRQKYMKNIRYHHVRALLGEGLLLSEAEEWRRQRLMVQPVFKAEPLNAQVGWMAHDIRSFLESWRGRSSFDVEPEFIRLAQWLSGRFIMGAAFEKIADRFCNAATAVKKSWPTPPRGLWDVLKPRPKNAHKGFEEALAELDASFFACLEEHRATDFAGCAILSLLVQASRAEGKPLTDRELRDQVFTLFFAGYETSATAMCWIHYFLSRHKNVRARLLQEVRATLGDRLPIAEDVEKLEYTKRVVQESLRLYSPIHSISRVALEDNTVGGYRIPAGATVCVSLYATHRLPEHWPDPERFDPERFTAEQCAARHRFAYIPFAAGHRNCIGGRQAMVELTLLVAQLAQRYTLDLVPRQRIMPAPGTTMYPRYGMRMTLHPAAARQ